MSFASTLKTHLQQHADLYFLVNTEGRIVACNTATPKGEPPWESSCNELLNLHRSCPCETCYINLAFQTGQPVIGQLDHPELGLFQIEVHPLNHPDGRSELAIFHIGPVPPKEPAQPVERPEEQTLDDLPQAIFDTDCEGRITFANRHCLELLGFTASTLSEEIALEHLVVPGDRSRLRQIFSNSLQDNSSLSSEFIAVTKSGESLFVMIHLTALVQNRQSIGIRGLLVDISWQKSAEGALAESEARYRQLVQHDQLTGLPNREMLTDWLGNALKRNGKNGKSLAVMLLDLDRFKQVVDFMGDNCGDQVLCEVTRRLSKQLRRNDILARLSGDEFVLAYDNISDPKSTSLLARRVLDALQAPMQIGQHNVYQTASIGIVTSRGGENPASLLRQAAMAMAEAKQQGGNDFAYFSQEMRNQREENFLFEKHMREALERKEFYLAYQPQIDLTNGRICGVEALVRWSGPDSTNPSPETFIKVAEESGLIHPLGDYILREACAQNLRWQQSGLAPFKVSVNISAKQFNQPDFVDKILQTLADTRLAPQWLELEITESAIMTNIHEALGTMRRLQQRGVNFAIDDFGTGHSSLNYLRQLALSKLKIDRSFIMDVPGNRDNEKLIISILALARSFNLQTVAEGIETQNQLAYLQQLDCDLGQGYLFSRPVTAEAISSLLSNDHR
jgi:diguanylate cyclase (GGDEF)-like protein/PAS domain S-box-containing protein